MSQRTGDAGDAVTQITIAVPILHVTSSDAAERFYCDGLGFRRVFAYRPHEDALDPCYMEVTRDGARLHLSSFGGDGVTGSAVYLRVSDVDALHRELRASGIPIALAPTDQTWGTRELYVEDADGNQLRFGESRD